MKNEQELQLPKRRILCIDGGGILGTFPAAFLAALEQHLQGRSIGSYFDLIAGTWVPAAGGGSETLIARWHGWRRSMAARSLS